jgi:hypothetical protein
MIISISEAGSKERLEAEVDEMLAAFEAEIARILEPASASREEP